MIERLGGFVSVAIGNVSPVGAEGPHVVTVAEPSYQGQPMFAKPVMRLISSIWTCPTSAMNRAPFAGSMCMRNGLRNPIAKTRRWFAFALVAYGLSPGVISAFA